jgi:multiple sugar transport system substrate-binding protein
MSDIKRRDFLKATAGVAAGTALGGGSALFAPAAEAQLKITPEKGAKLRVLRWKRFVQGDEDMWAANTKKFTQATGIDVRLDAEGWEDVRPKAAVAANVGSGPDIIISTMEDAHQYPTSLSTSATSRTTLARNTAAGTRPRKTTGCTTRSGSRS